MCADKVFWKYKGVNDDNYIKEKRQRIKCIECQQIKRGHINDKPRL